MKPYTFAVAWIAENDEPGNTEIEFVSSMISVILVADCYEKKVQKVAQDVIDYRNGYVSARFGSAMRRAHKRTPAEAKRIQEQRIKSGIKQVMKEIENLNLDEI